MDLRSRPLAVGLHGVLGRFVARRAPELGVRLALGTRAAEIFRIVAGQGGLPLVAGVPAGALGSVALGRVLASLLYEARPDEPEGSSYLRGLKCALSRLGYGRNVMAEPYEPYGPAETAGVREALIEMGLLQ